MTAVHKLKIDLNYKGVFYSRYSPYSTHTGIKISKYACCCHRTTTMWIIPIQRI